MIEYGLKMLYIYAHWYLFMYAICSVTITLVLIDHSMIYKEVYTGFSIKTSKTKYGKYKKYKKKSFGNV